MVQMDGEEIYAVWVKITTVYRASKGLCIIEILLEVSLEDFSGTYAVPRPRAKTCGQKGSTRPVCHISPPNRPEVGLK